VALLVYRLSCRGLRSFPSPPPRLHLLPARTIPLLPADFTTVCRVLPRPAAVRVVEEVCRVCKVCTPGSCWMCTAVIVELNKICRRLQAYDGVACLTCGAPPQGVLPPCLDAPCCSHPAAVLPHSPRKLQLREWVLGSMGLCFLGTTRSILQLLWPSVLKSGCAFVLPR
jgi:hypothetical protein